MTFTEIKNRVYFLTKTNSSSLSTTNLNLLVNSALNRVASLLMTADGRWEWDDTNQSDLPIATATITSGQQDYSPSVSFLQLLRVEVKDDTSRWHRLLPIDQTDFDEPLSAHFSSTGFPQYYDILANSVFLYPTPNYTQAASLKLYFKRAPLEFDYSDNQFTDDTGSSASTPGFSSLYHDLVPLWAAYDYCLTNLPQLAPGYLAEIQRKEDALIKDFTKRNRDDRPRMTMKPISYL